MLAIDSPLGWPDGLRDALGAHVAGQGISVPKDLTFRRASDRWLRSLEATSINPLEIGADRIARAAHEALTVLAEIRRRTGRALPLLWGLPVMEAGVIEVYPAATLRALGLPSQGYKKPEQMNTRRRIAMSLETRILGLLERVDGSADEFDACLCLAAALDFVNGVCVPPPPELEDIALREGWIWVNKAVRGVTPGR